MSGWSFSVQGERGPYCCEKIRFAAYPTYLSQASVFEMVVEMYSILETRLSWILVPSELWQ